MCRCVVAFCLALASRLSSTSIHQQRQKRADELPALEKTRELIGGLVNELRDFKKEQAALTADLEALKKERTEQAEKMAQRNFLLSALRQENNKLQSRIVHSPERLMQIIAEMNASIGTERGNLAQLERKSRELQMKLDALTQIDQDLSRTLTLLEQNDEIVKKRDALQIRLQDDKEAVNKRGVLIGDLELKEQQARRQFSQAGERHAKLLAQQDARRAQIEGQLGALRQDYTTLSEERARLLAKMDQTDRSIKDMESKLFELKNTHDQEMFNLRADCLNLKTQVCHYLSEVKKAM